MKQAFTLAGILLAAMISQPVRADTRVDVESAFSRCNVFADDRTWLNCIYGAVQPMRNKLGLPAAPPSQTNLVPSASLMPQAAPPSSPPVAQAAPAQPARDGDDSAGFVAFLVGGRPVLTDMPVTAYNIDHYGIFSITLANGQVWREVDGGAVAHWHEAPAHYKASIVKGSLNSYILTMAGEGIDYKVQRVR
jgi:hypothetical protein